MSHRHIGDLCVTDALDFACPFCNGQATASQEHAMVAHTIPVCPAYAVLHPLAYLEAVNAVLAQTQELVRRKTAN